MPLFDYLCPNKHVTEFRVDSSLPVMFCPECGEVAERQFGAPAMIVGPTLHPNLTRPQKYREAQERAEHGFRQVGTKRP